MKATTTRVQDCVNGRASIFSRFNLSRRTANRRRRTGCAALAVALLGMLAFAAPPASAQEPGRFSEEPHNRVEVEHFATGHQLHDDRDADAEHSQDSWERRCQRDFDYDSGALDRTCGPTPLPPAGSCQPASSLSVLVDSRAKTVVSYVPKGFFNGGVSGVSAVNVEGSSITPTLIPTPGVGVVNSCASNPHSRTTVCTANNTDIYLLSGTTLASTLTSGGSAALNFFGSSCTNCGVVMDAVHNRALIALSTGTPVSGGYQFLDLSTAPPTLGSVFASEAPTDTTFNFFGNISEGVLIDPTRNTAGRAGALLLSANQLGTYEIVDVTTPASPAFYENSISGLGLPSGSQLWPASSGEDCETSIALAPVQFSTPSQVYLADLRQAKFHTGTPGTWTTSASQVQSLSESLLSSGANGIAVAQGTNTGVITGKIGGGSLTAIALPTRSGRGVPAIRDWVTCEIPGFSMGYDPHTVTAYRSPHSGHAIAVLTNETADTLAVVDLTKMLHPAHVPRTAAGNGCASGTLPATVVRFVSVP